MSERGSVTLWLLGLAVVLLFLGGLSLDLWRVFSERRALTAAADAAAVAGAAAVDEAHLRATGAVRLDPPAAAARALQTVDAASAPARTARAASATPEQVTVRIDGEVAPTLLGVLLPGGAPFRLRVEATAAPRRSP